MPGKLITMYISNVKHVEQEAFFNDAVKLYIAREDNCPDSGIKALRDKGFIRVMELAPMENLLLGYKKEMVTWREYVDRFRKEMADNQMVARALATVAFRLDQGKDVILCCYEKDYKKCHRFILSNYFAELGYDCREYGRDFL